MATVLGLDAQGFRELRGWCDDTDLLALATACIEAGRRALAPTLERSFRPVPAAEALAAVSEEALRDVLAAGRNVHGVASERTLSNVIVFNARRALGAIRSAEVAALRARVDARAADKLRALSGDPTLDVVDSGHLWYPPGAYMAWHTNSEAPGVRVCRGAERRRGAGGRPC